MQQEFHQHLRAHAQSVVRAVIELVMHEELEASLGTACGETSPKRQSYGNGSYTQDLLTSAGRLVDLKVPRDRGATPIPRSLSAIIAVNLTSPD